ncbi:MAG: hypothetical protein MUO54_16490 [Anaerolineales bacterium]|nr:hypothetical protein [Anaerolineales bacterium]
MKKMRILAILAVLIAVLIPGLVSAAGTFYCSTSVTTGGTGSLDDPWACSDDTQLDTVINDQICDIYAGGDLYQIFPDSYRYHVVTWYSVDDCRVTATYDYAGGPPYTGVDVPTPYIVGAVALAGAGLLAAGIMIRRKKVTAV